mgnify:CR=1 FL=1
MFSPYLLVYIIIAYLLGSVPTSVWVGKLFYQIDIREHGSGNAGANNTIRVLGFKAGLPVLLVDVLKGWLAVSLPVLINGQFEVGASMDGSSMLNLQLLFGVMALLGHIFPVFAGFRGGKGVATLLGVCLAVLLYPTLLALVVFIIVLFSFKIVSLSSMSAGLSLPVFTVITGDFQQTQLIIFTIMLAVIILITHRNNIRRIIKGEEGKASFFK